MKTERHIFSTAIRICHALLILSAYPVVLTLSILVLSGHGSPISLLRGEKPQQTHIRQAKADAGIAQVAKNDENAIQLSANVR